VPRRGGASFDEFYPQSMSKRSPIVSAAVLAGAVVYLAHAVQSPIDDSLAAPTKPYSNFTAFYDNLYIPQHSKPHTKLTHFIGTGITSMLLLREPHLIPAMAVAAAVGITVFPFALPMSHGLLEGAAALGSFVFAGRGLTGRWSPALFVLLIAYGCAWFGHFFVEKNVPATFIYPSFSLMGDFRMFAECAAQIHPLME
jgi:hypothetical protein